MIFTKTRRVDLNGGLQFFGGSFEFSPIGQKQAKVGMQAPQFFRVLAGCLLIEVSASMPEGFGILVVVSRVGNGPSYFV